MSAIILTFPVRAAKVIPISATRVERNPDPCVTAATLDTMRDLYIASMGGDGSAIFSLKLISRSHSDCDVARLADGLLRDLSRMADGAVVDWPSDCEIGEPA